MLITALILLYFFNKCARKASKAFSALIPLNIDIDSCHCL